MGEAQNKPRWRVWILWTDFSWEEMEMDPPQGYNSHYDYLTPFNEVYDAREEYLNIWMRELYLAKEDLPFLVDIIYRGEVSENGN